MFSWLFSPGTEPPPPDLTAALGGADMYVSYVDTGAGEHGDAFPKRLTELAPGALTMFSPPRPPAHLHVPIGEWMVRAVADFCAGAGVGLPAGGNVPDVRCLCDARVTMTAPPPSALLGQPYAVVHPGSGSRLKNWPLVYFIDLCRRLAAMADASVAPPFRRLAVVSGEADGDAGERLAAAVPGSVHLRGMSLDSLAVLLANASLYLGNDSGVSHLAASVENRDNRFPRQVVLFGPSDASVWAPPGAHIVQSRGSLANLSPDEVMHAVRMRLSII